MTIRAFGTGFAALTAFLSLAFLWLAGGSQREKPVLASAPPVRLHALRVLEEDAAARPDDIEPTRALAQAYLDARQPGLAVVLVERAPPSVATDVRVWHIRARALIDEGRNSEALTAEEAVVAACGPTVAPCRSSRGCDPVLLASATRRQDILRELVFLGVDDSLAHPEESLVAYQNATREARVLLP
ncbi:MAG: hypothetical protein M3O36_16985 [Myxococcota bacterium]|nr:hypothetical protein [Myxococcota bacterium]